MTKPTASDVLDELFARPAEQGTSLAFVAVRGGEVIAERYGTRPANAFEPEQQITATTALTSWSMANPLRYNQV